MASPPAFRVAGAPPALPLLLSVPHAGRDYSRSLLASARVPASVLAALEDPLTDRLVEAAVARGAAAIIALAPRAEIDLNRSPADFDPAMTGSFPAAAILSRRARAGLGLIPSRLAGPGALWRGPLSPSEVERRIAEIHRPYHDAIGEHLAAIRARFGVAVLLDCHSMPARGASKPAIVLGDRRGTSSDESYALAAEAACRAAGFSVVRNDPYAGGEIAARHGAPVAGVHAIQIEIDRGMYLAADGRSAGRGFARVEALLAAIVQSVAATATARPMLIAAE